MLRLADAAAGAGDPKCVFVTIGLRKIANCDRTAGGTFCIALRGGAAEAASISVKGVSSMGVGTISSNGDQNAVRRTVYPTSSETIATSG